MLLYNILSDLKSLCDQQKELIRQVNDKKYWFDEAVANGLIPQDHYTVDIYIRNYVPTVEIQVFKNKKSTAYSPKNLVGIATYNQVNKWSINNLK